MATNADDDLAPSTTEGFKLSDKKTVDEYKKLDENDESLRRWKESLGIGAVGNDNVAAADPADPRRVIILSLGLEVEGREDIILDLTLPDALEQLKNKPFTIKEGASFCMKVKFKVQRDVLSGLKYIQAVKRKGIRVSKEEEMIGSFAPNPAKQPFYEKKFAPSEAPSGMLARGHYDAASKFIDDDMVTHLKFEWSFDIKKDW